MDELIELVMAKANMGEEQATQAVETVIDFLKQKLPAPLAGQIDSTLANDAMMGRAGDILDKGAAALGGLFGRKK